MEHNCTMSEVIKQMQNDISSMGNDVKEIKAALLGNEYNKYGYFQQIERLNRKVADLQKFRWIAVGFATAISSLVTMLVTNLLK